MFNLEMFLKKTGIYEFIKDCLIEIGLLTFMVGIAGLIIAVPLAIFFKILWLLFICIGVICVGGIISLIGWIKEEFFI